MQAPFHAPCSRESQLRAGVNELMPMQTTRVRTVGKASSPSPYSHFPNTTQEKSRALVYSGCHDKLPQTGQLTQQKLIFHSSRSWKSTIKMQGLSRVRVRTLYRRQSPPHSASMRPFPGVVVVVVKRQRSLVLLLLS